VSAPVAYIRRSVARRSDPGDVSREFQTDKVRGLANGDGSTWQIIDGDWGRSAAGEKTDKRLAFLSLLAAVERGEVSTLYAYSCDRLARSVRWSAQLLDACEAAGTTIVTGEGHFAPGDDMARQMFHFQAMQNEGALRQMTTKAGDAATKRKARGDKMGRAPYGYRHEIIAGVSKLVPREGEDPQHVVDMFVAAGSYLNAARTLNEEGWPTRFEGKKWDPTTVRHVVMRKAPELVPVRSRRGAKTIATRLFSGLLQCPHWQRHPATPTLTSMPTQWGLRYYCRVAHMDPDHPRPYIVSESKVLDWAKREAAQLGKRLDYELAGQAPNAEAKVAQLEQRRLRVLEMFEDDDITRDEKKSRLAAIEAERPAFESGRRAIKSFRLRDVIEWDADPGEINARLRELWQRIELGPDMLPVRAVWTVGQSPDEVFEAQAAAEAELEAAVRRGDIPSSDAEAEAQKLGMTRREYYAHKGAANEVAKRG
jgi:DNA invertase Pin-like site-specific DNA recombinase